jgi:transglutaminase-like putative cysteine protease
LQYKVTHTTTYHYFEPVSICHNTARLIPRSFDNQFCRRSVITIDPVPEIMNDYQDFFGNKVIYFAVQQEHKTLTVTVTSEIEKSRSHPEINLYSGITWEEIKKSFNEIKPELLDARQYIPETAMTSSTVEITAYAEQSYTPGRSMYAATQDLMQRIYKDFEFKPGFTIIATPLSEVMKERKGVCQDFAHLAIACIRSLGLPARYVSGYLETLPAPGVEKLAGGDASHAWFAVYIPNAGWIDFDPTNNQLPAEQHITIGWGRDYADIAPLKGVILSSGPHQLTVSVDVRRIV